MSHLQKICGFDFPKGIQIVKPEKRLEILLRGEFVPVTWISQGESVGFCQTMVFVCKQKRTAAKRANKWFEKKGLLTKAAGGSF